MTEPQTAAARGAWATRLGFLLAAVGSAVGLGNMWRFSYIAASGGGAAFVLVYLLFVAGVGIPLMTSEFVVGRLAQESPARALKRLGGTWWTPLGWLYVVCGVGILSYYSVIAGWTMRYALDALRNAIPTDTGTYFAAVSVGPGALVAHALFMAMTIAIVALGVKRGLERASIVMMPLLFLILIALAIWASTLSGAREAYGYYLMPSLGALFNRKVITDGAGQAFFSLSLGMGAMMTYASYLKSQENLAKEATVVALSDFGVAFAAGLVVFPVIFSFGLLQKVGESSIGTLFIALPEGFDALGHIGDYIDSAFFVMLFFAALTSAISLLEVVVAAAVDGWGWSRAWAAVVCGIAVTLMGVPSAFNTNFLGAMDAIVGQFLLIVGGFFTAIFVGYRLLPQAQDELSRGFDSLTGRRAWAFFVRYFAPLVLLVVIYFLLGPTWGAVRTLVGIR